MKAIIALIVVTLATSTFASTFRVYNYTYKNTTMKCAVTIFVPDTWAIKVERLCFNLSK